MRRCFPGRIVISRAGDNYLDNGNPPAAATINLRAAGGKSFGRF